MVYTIKFSQFQEANLSNETNQLAGVSSPSGGDNFQVGFPLTWDISTRPTSPTNGTSGYNSSLNQWEYWNGTAWVQFAAGGSGTVSVGAEYQIAYYTANGTTIGGLLTIPNAVLTTTSLGEPLYVTATGTGAPVLNNSPTLVDPVLGVASATSLQFTSTDGIIGTTTNDNANAGSVGYLLSSVIPSASSVTISNNTPTNLTSIVFPPGDYDVWGNIYFSASIAFSGFSAWSSTLSATRPDPSLYSVLNLSTAIGSLNIPQQRLSFAVQTTVYLSALVSFTSGTATMCGGIYARVRR